MTRRLALMLVTIVVALAGTVMTPANADVIDGAIKDVTIVQDSADFYDDLTVHLDWCIPDAAKEGDTFFVDLPDSLNSAVNGFDLLTPTGEVIAHATVSGKRVTFTITDVADELNRVCGDAEFDVHTVKSEIDGGEPNDFDFVTNSDTFQDTVDIGPKNTSDHDTPFKDGQWLTNDELGIQWRVDTSVGPWSAASVSDDLGPGQELDCSTVVVQVSTSLGPPVIFKKAPASRYTVDCNATDLTVNIGAASNSEMFRVRYQSTITDPTLDTYTNGATVTEDGRTWHRHHDVTRADGHGGGDGDVNPAIDIEKWSTADGLIPGDFDTAPGKQLTQQTDEPLTMTITNNGEERLLNVNVTDATDLGPAMTGLSCDFSPLGGPATGTTWDGPFMPGDAFECTGVVPGMKPGQAHTDTATVVGTGRRTGTTVTDNDPWSGYVQANPKIDIEKWSTDDGPIDGDYDTAPGKVLDPNADEPITMTITNEGNEDLTDVVVSDATLNGPSIKDLTCDFSALGGPATGTTWAGPFLAGDSFDCTATLPGMSGGEYHADDATVNGAGRYTGTPVTDDDKWHAHVPAKPAIDIEKWSTDDGIVAGDYDTAPGKVLEAGKDESVSMTITNTGNESLVDVEVTDATDTGPDLHDISCDFSPLGGPSTGTTWDGPFKPGDSFVCTGVLDGMQGGQTHADTATVVGTGEKSQTKVTDDDPWNALVAPKPVVDIEKWSTDDGPVKGDYDDAPGKVLAAGKDESVSMTITNTGNEPLIDVVVSDATDDGPALVDISCDFSKLGGPSAGTTWDGPFKVGDSFECTGTLPGMEGGQVHADTATVDGAGQFSGTKVTDDDPWHANVPGEPDIDIEKYSTDEGPTNGDHDDAPGQDVPAGTPVPITMTITNNGSEPLLDVVVVDHTDDGPAIEGLTCDFSKLGGPSSGTTWDGPFKVGDSFDCTGTVPAMDGGDTHADTATATGVGEYTGKTVNDHDEWHAHTPEVSPPGTPELPNTGGLSFALPVLGSLLFMGGWLVLGLRRRNATS